MVFQCLNCTTTGENGTVVEFSSKSDWLAHMKAHKRGEILPAIKDIPAPVEKEPVVPEPEVAPAVPVPVEPVILSYTYHGQHECRTNVETLHVEVEGSYVVIAYCPSCKVQITQQKVIPLAQQFQSDGKKKSTS